MKKHGFAPFAVAAILVACGGAAEKTTPAPAPAPPAPTAAPAAAGSISGVVSYNGSDPDTPIAMDADPVCSGLHSSPVTTQTVEASGGNLGGAFVYVKEGVTGSYPPPSEPLVLDQQGCTYHPHVWGIRAGQKLVIRNSDPTLHNIHALPTANAEFNQGQPFQGMETERTFDKPEVMVKFKCDVHPWMSGWMGVMNHPFFAVSGADGSFSIPNLPAGNYVVEAWHEALGTRTQNVTIPASGSVAVAFDFSS
jgi:plastocyanin